MNPDRHIYLTTTILALVAAAAISVLAPRDPLAGTTMHRETSAASRTAQILPADASPNVQKRAEEAPARDRAVNGRPTT